jgi:hypothetical protein
MCITSKIITDENCFIAATFRISTTKLLQLQNILAFQSHNSSFIATKIAPFHGNNAPRFRDGRSKIRLATKNVGTCNTSCTNVVIGKGYAFQLFQIVRPSPMHTPRTLLAAERFALLKEVLKINCRCRKYV